ncbi:phospho-sugar mutase [Shewanella youngdeokensis]|uniref:Phospho-sugar mutase n=1 Tax=Shewanella youngdeokensis TaxID=2999068 RepID=A0ABZ0JUY9_9GAMM|nr:phospho-sugar mutase [Shewanella sp. DAU334]
MDTQLKFRVQHWLNNDPDPMMRAQLQTLIDSDDEVELKARFSGRLAFGTAGLRGVVGAGPQRMNRLVVQQTSAGLGAYLLSQMSDVSTRGVVIGYDGRHDSQQFAEDAATVLCGLGIKVYLTAKLIATPLVAYGVLQLGAAAGIMVTASHNPPQYNGYKVYWGNGAQIIPPHDTAIAACIEKAANEKLVVMPLRSAIQCGRLQWLTGEFYQAYRDGVNQSPLLQNQTQPRAVSLAYTAMHGVGNEMALALLHDAGFTNVYSVAAQAKPDGDFPTILFPNPEEKGAMDAVIAEAKQHNAMLACANDPDADRFAVAVRNKAGEYPMLTGDQVGALFGYYLLCHAPDNKRLTCTTIVSSSLLSKIAASLDGHCHITLTGFKWLTNVGMSEQTDDNQFLFAYEEALGYTLGSMVWDKDGLSALVGFAQLTAELVNQGLTIWNMLESIYREHGYHLNQQVNIALKPNTKNMGNALRNHPPITIAGQQVISIDDLKLNKRMFADGSEEKVHLPTSDVLVYWLENNARVIVRPSGTEPKIKCYYEVVVPMVTNDTLALVEGRAQQQMDQLIKAHQASLPR